MDTNNAISYSNSTEQVESTINHIPGSTLWDTTITVTQTNTNFVILNTVKTLTSSGTMTGNIYINGSIVATQTNPSYTTPPFMAGIDMTYFIQ